MVIHLRLTLLLVHLELLMATAILTGFLPLLLVHSLPVLALLLLAGWNDTCYYPSLTDMQSSLAITNSSSSLFTLKVMSVVSLLIPFVAAYIWYAWRALTRPISEREVEEAEHKY